MKIWILTLLLSAIITGCAKQPDYISGRKDITDDEYTLLKESLKKDPDNTNMNMNLWNYYAKKNRYDSIIKHAKPLYAKIKDRQDELSSYAALNLARAYLFLEKPDSANKYVSECERFISIMQNDIIWNITLNNISAILAIKTEMDYPKALKYFKNAYDYSVSINDMHNSGVILCNISAIYFIRKDTTGMKYAKLAYEYSLKNHNEYSKGMAALFLSSMYYLAQEYGPSEKYYKESIEILERNNITSLLPDAYTVAGDLETVKKNYDKAEEYYLKSLSFNERRNDAFLYLRYGNLMFEKGDYQKAITLFRNGIEAAEKSQSMEYRYELYKGMANSYYELGDKDSTIKYVLKHYQEKESVFNIQNESEFNQLLRDYDKVVYEKKIQEKESSTYIAVLLLAVISVICASIWVMYRRKNRMYRQIVEQHRQLLQEKENIRGLATRLEKTKESGEDNQERELYEKIEHLMNEEKAYRMNDISLDKLAEMIGTNRTYISRAINNFTGKSFYNYVNSYRIEEATRILADPEKDIPLKNLSDMLGYNSISVFYRVFQKEIGCPPSKYREQSRKIEKDKDQNDQE